MSTLESDHLSLRGRIDVERFLLFQMERRMTADARGYMGADWMLPFTGAVIEADLNTQLTVEPSNQLPVDPLAVSLERACEDREDDEEE